MKSENSNIQEINLSEILQSLKNGKRTLLYFFIVFFILGLISVFLSEKLYTSSIKFIPQLENESNLGGLNGMASLAGISLGGNQNVTSTIPSSMYPTIVGGIPFKLLVLDRKIYYKETGDSITVRDYFNEYYEKPSLFYIRKYSIGIISTLRGSLNNNADSQLQVTNNENGIILTSPSDNYIFSRLNQFISIDPGAKEGYSTLSVSMPEPQLASQLNQICMEVLQFLLIEYKIANAKKEFNFLENQYQIKKKDYENAQLRLAQYKDRNQGLISESSQIKQQTLQYEFDLSFSLFSEIASNLEQARIKISKDTPIFSVIDPVVEPKSKSHPNIPLYLIGFMFFGLFAGITFVYVKEFLNK